VGVQTPVPVAALSVQKTSVPVAALSVQKTSAEIEELSLRTPRPVATTECPTSRWPKASGGCQGIGMSSIEDVSLRSSHPCDNG